MDCYNAVGSSNLNLCCWSRLETSGWDLVARLEGECLILLAVMEEVGLWRISKMGFSFAATAVLLFGLARLVWLMENVFSLLCRWAPAAQWQAVPHHPDVHSRGGFLLWSCSADGVLQGSMPLPPVGQELNIHSGAEWWGPQTLTWCTAVKVDLKLENWIILFELANFWGWGEKRLNLSLFSLSFWVTLWCGF